MCVLCTHACWSEVGLIRLIPDDNWLTLVNNMRDSMTDCGQVQSQLKANNGCVKQCCVSQLGRFVLLHDIWQYRYAKPIEWVLNITVLSHVLASLKHQYATSAQFWPHIWSIIKHPYCVHTIYIWCFWFPISILSNVTCEKSGLIASFNGNWFAI